MNTKALTRWWSRLLHWLYPDVCVICGEPLVKGEERVCLRCLCDLPHTDYHWKTNNPVEQLLIGKIPFEHASAYLRFEKGGKTQKLIHRLKYRGDKEMGFLLGRQMARDLLTGERSLGGLDLLVPVPLHPRKRRKRGYNQSECIAEGIRSLLDIPIDNRSLTRGSDTRTQTRKAVYERWMNVSATFRLTDPEALRDKHILLIDDVITTGSTLCACAEALSDVPGIRISVLAAAIARD